MSDLPFSQLMRLIWIDARLSALGKINRADICAAFAVSVPQASGDLRTFQTAHPSRMIYDASAKTYRRAPHSQPVYPAQARVFVQRAATWVEAIRTGRNAG